MLFVNLYFLLYQVALYNFRVSHDIHNMIRGMASYDVRKGTLPCRNDRCLNFFSYLFLRQFNEIFQWHGAFVLFRAKPQ